MITLKTKICDIYKGSDLEYLTKYLYYGWDIENDHREIGSLYPDIWPNKHTVNDLNELLYMNKQGLVEVIHFDKTKKDVNVIYLKQKKRAKYAIIAAGGAYVCVCSGVESLPVGMELYKKGFNVFLLTYSIIKDAYNGGANEDLINAIRYINNHSDELNVDPVAYIAGGFSAGGHLISSLLTDNLGASVYGLNDPKLVFLGYPVITFGDTSHSTSKRIVIGENPSTELMNKFSTELHISSTCPKVFFWQCERDNQVSINNTLLLDKALNDKNIKHIYKTYDSEDHGWGIADEKPAKNWINEMIDFYNQD